MIEGMGYRVGQRFTAAFVATHRSPVEIGGSPLLWPIRPANCPHGRAIASVALLTALLIAPPSDSHAGGGPENVFVVVNASSWASRTVANYYVYLRAIPPSNVFLLPWTDSQFDDRLKVDAFREKLLKPTLEEIARRDLVEQIDCIVYSSDFPYDIDVRPDTGGIKLPDHLKPTASLTSMTYLWHRVMAADMLYMSGAANQYALRDAADDGVPPTLAFRGNYYWDEQGERITPGAGRRYLICTMLAATTGRGNSVGEAVQSLYRSVRADGTKPSGTIYFTQNLDVRSKVRHGQYPSAVAALESLGVRAEVVDGVLPKGKDDVMGLLFGIRDFNWATTGSTILPGAICENLTSTGAVLREGGQQTALTELIRHGAAGTSGTVDEPLALAQKFPRADMHVHYARGCSLGEAFYQSVEGPYQLLIIGDPLCQPWATVARVGVRGIRPGDTVSGTVHLEPFIAEPPSIEVDHFELFIGGQRAATCKPGEDFAVDTTTFPDGHHELRVVAVEASPIETQSRSGIACIVDNNGLTCTLAAEAETKIPLGQSLKLTAASPGATRLVLLRAGEMLDSADGERAEFELDTAGLGFGPVDLWAVAEHEASDKGPISSASLRIQILPPEPLPAQSRPVNLVPGLQLKIGEQTPKVQTEFTGKWLPEAGVEADQAYTLSGFFEAPEDDIYQFQAAYLGTLSIAVDGQTIYDGTSNRYGTMHAAPVTLARGTHQLEIQGRAGTRAALDLRFGAKGTYRLQADNFRHAP